jgi:ADP-ribose pyrophosphatase YjhB (NUDIX family)
VDLASINFKGQLNSKLSSNEESEIYCEQLPNQEVKHVTVAMLLVKDDKVLLVKKADPLYSGRYSVVAGHVNNNESPFDAVVREVKEEIDLSLKSPQFVMKMEDVRDKCRYNGVLHDWFVFHTTEVLDYEALKADASEISEIKLVNISELKLYAEKMTFGCKKLFESLGYL